DPSGRGRLCFSDCLRAIRRPVCAGPRIGWVLKAPGNGAAAPAQGGGASTRADPHPAAASRLLLRFGVFVARPRVASAVRYRCYQCVGLSIDYSDD
ncbi:unnamed protein product, partial [Amoebophrya sp. A120]